MKARLLCLAALLTCSGPGLADGLLRKAPDKLDPTKAYLIVELGLLDDALMPASLTIARYDTAASDISVPAPKPAGAKGPWSPDNRISLVKPLAKEGNRRLMVAEVTPGLWVIEGANDTAFSLGSSTVVLEPGTVTDLGVARVYSDFSEGEKQDIATTGRMIKSALLGGLFMRPLPRPVPRAVEFRGRQNGDLLVPGVLGASAKPLLWAGEVRFGNHLGGLVNRMGGRKARYRAMAQQHLGDVQAQPGPAASAPTPDLAPAKR